MRKTSKAIWPVPITAGGLTGLTMDLAGPEFTNLECVRKKEGPFQLTREHRLTIERAVADARMELQQDQDAPLAVDVLPYLMRVQAAASSLRDVLSVLENGKEMAAARAAVATLEWDIEPLDYKGWIEALEQLWARAARGIAMAEPARPGRKTPEAITRLILTLAETYESATGKDLPDYWTSRSIDTLVSKAGKPGGPFFEFVRIALQFVVEANPLPAETLADRLEAARVHRNKMRERAARRT